MWKVLVFIHVGIISLLVPQSTAVAIEHEKQACGEAWAAGWVIEGEKYSTCCTKCDSYDLEYNANRNVLATSTEQAKFDGLVFEGLKRQLKRNDTEIGFVVHILEEYGINSEGGSVLFPKAMRNLNWTELSPADRKQFRRADANLGHVDKNKKNKNENKNKNKNKKNTKQSSNAEMDKWSDFVGVSRDPAFAMIQEQRVREIHRNWYLKLALFLLLLAAVYSYAKQTRVRKLPVWIQLTLLGGMVAVWVVATSGNGDDSSDSSDASSLEVATHNSIRRTWLHRTSMQNSSEMERPTQHQNSFDLIVSVVSPTMASLILVSDWQSDLGPGCAITNHQKHEHDSFIKSAFLYQVKSWGQAKRNCDYSELIPPTYFLNLPDDDWIPGKDCKALFGQSDAEVENDIYFAKDPYLDGYGRGISLHTMTTMREKWKMQGKQSGESLESGCADILTKLQETDRHILVQEGVKPLLLWGQRKFDIRLYVLITDRVPMQIWTHAAYLRFADGATKSSANGTLDISQHIANVNLKKTKVGIDKHWVETSELETLLGEPEAKPILDSLGIDAAAAYTLVTRNIHTTLARSMEAMIDHIGGQRGGYLLIGADILIDTQLRALMLETNIDPEFSNDRVRGPIMDKVSTRKFQLLAETNLKMRELFGGDGTCFSQSFSPVSRNSPAGRELLKTNVPGWTLLFTDAVEPVFSAAENETHPVCEY